MNALFDECVHSLVHTYFDNAYAEYPAWDACTNVWTNVQTYMAWPYA